MDDQITHKRENLARLFSALDPDPERAAAAFEDVRRRLISFFARNGANDPEELADATIDRVIKRFETYRPEGDQSLVRFFRGFARNILFEHYRSSKRVVYIGDEEIFDSLRPNGSEPEPAEEPEILCLDNCLQTLAPEDRELLLAYYEHDGAGKAKVRKALADRAGLTVSALHTKIYRLRESVGRCLTDCLEKKSVRF